LKLLRLLINLSDNRLPAAMRRYRPFSDPSAAFLGTKGEREVADEQGGSFELSPLHTSHMLYRWSHAIRPILSIEHLDN